MASFIARPAKSYKSGWRLIKEESGKQTVVPKSAWAALGLRDKMSLDEARVRAKQLNAENMVKRQEQASIARIAARLERDSLHHSAFVPEDLNQQFLKWLESNVSPKQVEKTKIVWNTSKKILIKLQVTMENLAANKNEIYRYLAMQTYSYAYSKQLIRLMNQYREFVSRMTGKHYEKLPTPKGHQREMINDAYFDSDSYLGPSDPLTPEMLESAKSNLKDNQYRWLYCSVWFGLRPEEVRMINDDRDKKFWRIEHDEVDVLWVYQSKLKNKPRTQRWKPIPLLFDEQKKAHEYIVAGNLFQPIPKTMQTRFEGRVTRYGGRKGFTDLMLDRGQRLEDIAQWLGHASIEMTWTHYKDKRRVNWVKPA